MTRDRFPSKTWTLFCKLILISPLFSYRLHSSTYFCTLSVITSTTFLFVRRPYRTYKMCVRLLINSQWGVRELDSIIPSPLSCTWNLCLPRTKLRVNSMDCGCTGDGSMNFGVSVKGMDTFIYYHNDTLYSSYWMSWRGRVFSIKLFIQVLSASNFISRSISLTTMSVDWSYCTDSL